MPEVNPETIEDWRHWSAKWHRRIACLASSSKRPAGRRPRRAVRAGDVQAAWVRLFMRAVDPEYVMPDWWLALSRDEKRASQPPPPILQARRVSPASERGPGFSLDDVGPYFKLPDGTVFRDRASARKRLWRDQLRYPGVAQILEMLPKRMGNEEHPVRGRMPERVLDALVCYGLVHAGMTRIAAASLVLDWTTQTGRAAEKYADGNRIIWNELGLPPVRA